MEDISIQDFVKHLPYETHLHSVHEAQEVLCYWRDEIQEQIPDKLDALQFFKAHVLHEAGYDNINPEYAWMELETSYDNDVYFEIDNTTFYCFIKLSVFGSICKLFFFACFYCFHYITRNISASSCRTASALRPTLSALQILICRPGRRKMQTVPALFWAEQVYPVMIVFADSDSGC